MFKQFVTFIKYHNALPIGVAFLLLATGGALAASPELREGAREALVKAEEKVQSIDNSFIVNANLDTYTPKVHITEITEDEEYYYVTYTLQTIDLEDFIWQEVSREEVLKVSKESLGGGDLGLYSAEELGEVVNHRLSYLKEVQEIERGRGITQKVIATAYSGLIGKFLSPTEETFSGYEPVITQDKITGRRTSSNWSGNIFDNRI